MTEPVRLAAYLPTTLRRRVNEFTLTSSVRHFPFSVHEYKGQPLAWYANLKIIHERAPKGVTHYVVDCDGDAWHMGTQESCAKYLHTLELNMARHLMTEGTSAEES